jgi:hypothetical protein
LISVLSTVALYRFNASVISQIILLAPIVVTVCLTPLALRDKSDILYYFILDGLMALSGMLMMLENP